MQGYPPPGGYGPPPGGYGPPPGFGAPPGPPGYGPPPGGGFAPMPPPNPGGAAAQVGAPAIGLIVTAIIGMLWQLLSVVLNLLGTGLGALGAAEGGGFSGIFSGVIGLVFNVVWLLMGGLVIFGALKMKNLQSYGLSMAASVIAALPCTSPCCFLGLPIGIWAIVVLMNQDVKASFRG